MKVECRSTDLSQCPPHIEPYARDTNVTMGREYPVHAIAVYEGVVSYLLIDDLNYPSWTPAWLFTTTDLAMPGDWICNAFPGGPELVIGPSFLAESQDAYATMVELDAAQVDRLRQRVVTLQATGSAA